MYVNTLQKIGFEIIKFEEPLPTHGTPEEYRYDYPRFLFIKCVKPASNLIFMFEAIIASDYIIAG